MEHGVSYRNWVMAGAKGSLRDAARVTGLAVAFAVFATGCVVEPAPTYPSVYDRAWDSALRAAQDSGIVVTSSDRGSGTIRGTKDGIDANIVLRRQADGTTRVESNFRGQLDRDPTLSRRFDAAYERNMGR